MIQTALLSSAALSLLRRHASGETISVDDANREDHRELAGAGLMVAMHTFTGGRETRYKFTTEGWEFANATWPEECSGRRR